MMSFSLNPIKNARVSIQWPFFLFWLAFSTKDFSIISKGTLYRIILCQSLTLNSQKWEEFYFNNMEFKNLWMNHEYRMNIHSVMYSVHSVMYSVHSVICSVHSVMYSLHSVIYIIFNFSLMLKSKIHTIPLQQLSICLQLFSRKF